jgi:serine/threonine-protein kinase
MMGVVYEAKDPVLARTIALKTIELAFSVGAAERESFEKRFFAEARVAARLSHPGILVVHDIGRDPDTGLLFIAFEHLKGRTLAEVIAAGAPLEWREALRIVQGVAEALHHAHAEGVVHRDIKPANIMLLPDGGTKIMDFGIAKLEAVAVGLTSTGQFFGTPAYMAPEQAMGQEIDGRADLFSLGATAYALLTGQLAFAADNMVATIGKVARHDPAPPSQLTPGLPGEVDYVLARALAKAPADRYANARMLAEDTSDILAGRPPRHRASWTLLRRRGPWCRPVRVRHAPFERPATALTCSASRGGSSARRLPERLRFAGPVVSFAAAPLEGAAAVAGADGACGRGRPLPMSSQP